MIALSTQDVCLAYGTDVILKDISFAVNDGDRVGIIGVNGAGKKYIFLSYNNEGLMSFDTIEKIMKKYGKYKVYMQQYRRFKADNARDAKSDSTIEYLHCLIKDI